MRRVFPVFVLLVIVVGCASTSERLAITPFPEEGQPVPYADLVTRARAQATAASEAFYVDRWGDLEDIASALEQTARFLPKATEPPAKIKETLPDKAETLRKDAVALKDAAKAKEVKKTNEVLTRINLQVRELRPENGDKAAPK